MESKNISQSPSTENKAVKIDSNYNFDDFSQCNVKIKYNKNLYSKTDSNYIVENIKSKYTYKSLAEDESVFIDYTSKNPLSKDRTFLLKQNDENLAKQGFPLQIYCSNELIPSLPFELNNENLDIESLASLQSSSDKLIKNTTKTKINYGKISNLGGITGINDE